MTPVSASLVPTVGPYLTSETVSSSLTAGSLFRSGSVSTSVSEPVVPGFSCVGCLISPPCTELWFSLMVCVSGLATGASLTPVTEVPKTTVLALTKLVPPTPPLVVRLTVAPEVRVKVLDVVSPLVLFSTSRSVRSPGVPFQSGLGTNWNLVSAPSNNAELSPTVVGMLTHVLPSQYCHSPCAAVAALPVTATPQKLSFSEPVSLPDAAPPFWWLLISSRLSSKNCPNRPPTVGTLSAGATALVKSSATASSVCFRPVVLPEPSLATGASLVGLTVNVISRVVISTFLPPSCPTVNVLPFFSAGAVALVTPVLPWSLTVTLKVNEPFQSCASMAPVPSTSGSCTLMSPNWALS